MNHTPTPWKVKQLDKGYEIIVGADGMHVGFVNFLKRKGDAEHAVACVNAHDAMVEIVFYLSKISLPEDFADYDPGEMAELGDMDDVFISRTKIRAARAVLAKVEAS